LNIIKIILIIPLPALKKLTQPVPFNPELHQAMTLMESADLEPNHVMMVMQKGYTLNGRLLRPAMVAVSKAKA